MFKTHALDERYIEKTSVPNFGFYNSDQNNYLVLRLWLVQDLKPFLDSSVTKFTHK